LIKRGETRSDDFERTAMVHTKSLLRAALRITDTRTAAEDLVQETLLRAWRSFEQFAADTDCKAWLFRILFNCSNERRRKKSARPQHINFEDCPVGEEHSMRSVPLQHNHAEVVEALDSLHDEHRIVLVLAVVEGFTCKEMAAMLEIPIGTVMSRLSRARVNLRQALTQ